MPGIWGFRAFKAGISLEIENLSKSTITLDIELLIELCVNLLVYAQVYPCTYEHITCAGMHTRDTYRRPRVSLRAYIKPPARTLPRTRARANIYSLRSLWLRLLSRSFIRE